MSELPDVQIRHDFEPVGTVHTLSTLVTGIPKRMRYRVYSVTGTKMFAPNPDPPMIHLEVMGRYGFSVTPFLSVTLPMFADRFIPESKGDLFWKYTREREA